MNYWEITVEMEERNFYINDSMNFVVDSLWSIEPHPHYCRRFYCSFHNDRVYMEKLLGIRQNGFAFSFFFHCPELFPKQI